MIKSSNITIGIIALVFVTAGAWYGGHRLTPSAAEPAAVTSLFAQSLPDVAGKQQPLAQWRGKPMLVNFWASWCTPCVQEMPELSALQQELGPNSLRIVGIGIDSSANIREFAQKLSVEPTAALPPRLGKPRSRQRLQKLKWQASAREKPGLRGAGCQGRSAGLVRPAAQRGLGPARLDGQALRATVAARGKR